jgi:hypothetical protein
MPEIASFSRNKFSGVERMDESTLRSFCVLNDTLINSDAEIRVRLPHLEIISIRVDIRDAMGNSTSYDLDDFSDIMGMRIGPGMRRIIADFTSGMDHGHKVASMIDECCNSVILAFTKRQLLKAPKDPEAEKEFFKKMVKANPRLLNSCAALSSDSPLLESVLHQEMDKRDQDA